MNKKVEEVEIIRKVRDLIIEDVILNDEYESYLMLDDEFSEEEIEYLIKHSFIEKQFVLICECCKNNLITVNEKEIELYDYYFDLCSKEEKSLNNLMTQTSIEQILDFKIKCHNCKNEIFIKMKEDVKCLLKKEVYIPTHKGKRLAFERNLIAI